MPGPIQADHPSVLIVDDDPLFTDSLRFLLENEGYAVREAATGDEALREARRSEPDVVLLDITLPGADGYEVCRRLREFTLAPILMVTGRRMEPDKVTGLDSGADDYVTKPVSSGELLARMRAALRRARQPVPAGRGSLSIGDFVVDRFAREISLESAPLTLSAREYLLLEYLLLNSGRAIPRDELFEAVWGTGFYGDRRALDVYVHVLRKKIEIDPDSPRHLLTIRGVGYRLVPRMVVPDENPPD